jgi:phosphonate transport system ATP-binding protein
MSAIRTRSPASVAAGRDALALRGPVVALRDAEVVYPGGTIALKPTSLAFKEGAFTVLLGLSGAGKSTLLRCINLLAVPLRGSIRVSGVGLVCAEGAVDPGAVRRHRGATAMIFQSHQLIGRHTALRNTLLGRVAFHGALRSFLPLPRADRLVALQCLERVGLADKALTRTDRLSGGQQQRVGIARALAQEPRLILADEPVASLDPATAEKVLSLLHRICREDGLTAIVSLHQLSYAKRFADRIIGLVDGAVAFDGPPAALTMADVAKIYGRSIPAQHPDELPSEAAAARTLASMEAFA